MLQYYSTHLFSFTSLIFSFHLLVLLSLPYSLYVPGGVSLSRHRVKVKPIHQVCTCQTDSHCHDTASSDRGVLVVKYYNMETNRINFYV